MGHLQEEIVENHNKLQLTVAGMWLKLHSRSSRIQSRRVHAMAQADSCWPLTAETQVQSQARTYGICGEQSGTGTGCTFEYFCFLPSALFYPCSIHIHLLPCYIISATDSVVKTHTHTHTMSVTGLITSGSGLIMGFCV